MKNIKNKTFIFLFLVTISVIPRIIKLVSREDYFGGDFAFYYFLTRSIVIDHSFPLIGHVVGDIGGFAQGVGWNYFLILPFIITGGNPYGAKVFVFGISILTVVLGSLLFWRYFGREGGIFAALLLFLSPNLLNWSTSVWPPYTIPLFTVLYLGFFTMLLVKNKKKYFILMTLSLGLMIHFEIASFGLLLPSYILLLIYLTSHHTLKMKDILLALFIYILLFLPHIFYDISHNFYNIRGLIGILPFGKTSFYPHFFTIFANRIHLFKTDIVVVFPSVPFKIIFFFLLFLFFGAYLYIKERSIKKWRKIFILYLLATIFTSWVGLTLLPLKQASFWWMTFLTVFYIFFSGIILSFLWSQKLIIYKILIIVFLFIFIQSKLHEFSPLLQQEKNQRGIKYVIRIQEPIEYIYEDSKNRPLKILYVTESSKVLDYKYMLWYVGKTKYKNSPLFKSLDLRFINPGGVPMQIHEDEQFKNLKRGIYYIIITSKSIQNGYAYSLLRNPALGKLISTKYLGNSFVVQKRYVE